MSCINYKTKDISSWLRQWYKTFTVCTRFLCIVRNVNVIIILLFLCRRWNKLLLRITFCPFRIGTVHEDVTTEVLGHIGSWQWLVTLASAALMTPSIINEYEDMLLLEPSTDVFCDLPDTFSVSNSSLCTFTVLNDTKEIKCSKWHVRFMWTIWIKKTVTNVFDILFNSLYKSK